jgi:crotonobetainyl-CoA:carnitine CoA-transferase CaiB-like acyl-CoA transferase
MFADPQVRHRGLIKYATDAEVGEVPHIRTPVKIGEAVRVRTVAPKLGQHNAEIFGHLGVSEAEMRELRNRGRIVNPPAILPPRSASSGNVSFPIRPADVRLL